MKRLTKQLLESPAPTFGDIPVGGEGGETPLQALCSQLPNTSPDEWTEVDGPPSGVGVDHYFHHAELGTWWVNDDQGEYSVSQTDEAWYAS